MQLKFERDRVSLRVQDDGQGFDPERVRQSLGLTTMQMRAQALGAQYYLDSQPEIGTVVLVESTQTGV